MFFDNVQVTHERGAILDETHYYPFGLMMAGISSKAAGSLKNNKGYNGNELQSNEFSDNSGLELYDFNARTYDQQTGRFIQIDPLTDDEDQESLTPYQFGWNSPIRNSDPGGKCPGCWRAMQLAKLKAAQQNGGNTFSPLSSFIYQGKASIQANNARTDYNTKAAQLDPGDKAGRAQLKVEARNNTPEPFKSAIEQGRPIAGEKAKVNDPNFKGNATKTNAEVNEVAKTTGTIGKVFIGATAVQSTYTIATSDNPVRETATEAAGWVGAMYVGGQFATAGSATGGPVGGVLGGVVGSGIGFMVGKKAGDAAIEAASTPRSWQFPIIFNIPRLF